MVHSCGSWLTHFHKIDDVLGKILVLLPIRCLNRVLLAVECGPRVLYEKCVVGLESCILSTVLLPPPPSSPLLRQNPKKLQFTSTGSCQRRTGVNNTKKGVPSSIINLLLKEFRMRVLYAFSGRQARYWSVQGAHREVIVSHAGREHCLDGAIRIYASYRL